MVKKLDAIKIYEIAESGNSARNGSAEVSPRLAIGGNFVPHWLSYLLAIKLPRHLNFYRNFAAIKGQVRIEYPSHAAMQL